MGTVSSPLAQNFLALNGEAGKILDNMGEIFHSVAAKLLYPEKGHGQTLKWQWLFLCIRVERTDLQDRKKLNRVITWLQQTIIGMRIIFCDNLEILFTCIYAYYSVWDNMRSHTG